MDQYNLMRQRRELLKLKIKGCLNFHIRFSITTMNNLEDNCNQQLKKKDKQNYKLLQPWVLVEIQKKEERNKQNKLKKISLKKEKEEKVKFKINWKLVNGVLLLVKAISLLKEALLFKLCLLVLVKNYMNKNLV